ncbi:MAG TPA: hypothetical protein VGY54_05970 [Polyangiaceae bacterium]|nr:hypothetical protein [Polyangiaceae bacterium]
MSRRPARALQIVGSIADVEAIAAGREIRGLGRLKKIYGGRRWRKLKGIATVRLPDGTTARAEVHSYERHGLGRREMKIKRLLGEG